MEGRMTDLNSLPGSRGNFHIPCDHKCTCISVCVHEYLLEEASQQESVRLTVPYPPPYQKVTPSQEDMANQKIKTFLLLYLQHDFSFRRNLFFTHFSRNLRPHLYLLQLSFYDFLQCFTTSSRQLYSCPRIILCVYSMMLWVSYF